jgi:hypothetical protein
MVVDPMEVVPLPADTEEEATATPLEASLGGKLLAAIILR